MSSTNRGGQRRPSDFYETPEKHWNCEGDQMLRKEVFIAITLSQLIGPVGCLIGVILMFALSEDWPVYWIMAPGVALLLLSMLADQFRWKAHIREEREKFRREQEQNRKAEERFKKLYRGDRYENEEGV